jgi:sodium transport system permease protein
MMRAAGAVCRKELVEALRDRRTVVLSLLVPVLLMPAITLGLPYLAVREETRLRAAPARVAVSGRRHLLGFLQMATAGEWIVVVDVREPQAALARGAVDAVLEAHPAGGGPVRVRLLYDETSVASLLARQKIDEAVARYSLQEVEAQLARRGVTAESLLPLAVDHVTIRPAQDGGRGSLAAVLPFFMTVWMMLGGQYAALDLGAGERERGTLPGLLLTPPPRLALVFGKFAAVFTLATGSVLLVVGSVLLSLRLASPFLGASAQTIPWRVALPLCGVGVSLAAFLSAMQLLLSIAARSVREAQQLFTPLYLTVVASVALAQLLPDWGRQLWLYALPVLNGAYLLRGLLLETVGPREVGLAVAGLVTLTGVALALGAWVYRRERLVAG